MTYKRINLFRFCKKNIRKNDFFIIFDVKTQYNYYEKRGDFKIIHYNFTTFAITMINMFRIGNQYELPLVMLADSFMQTYLNFKIILFINRTCWLTIL